MCNCDARVSIEEVLARDFEQSYCYTHGPLEQYSEWERARFAMLQDLAQKATKEALADHLNCLDQNPIQIRLREIKEDVDNTFLKHTQKLKVELKEISGAVHKQIHNAANSALQAAVTDPEHNVVVNLHLDHLSACCEEFMQNLQKKEEEMRVKSQLEMEQYKNTVEELRREMLTLHLTSVGLICALACAFIFR